MDPAKFFQLVSENRYTLSLDDGQLTGTGAQLLTDAAKESQFMVIGEEHGTAEIPLIAAAVFQALYDDGYHYLCAEISPLMAEKLSHIIKNDGRAGLEALVKDDPWLVPFYGWSEDAHLLDTVFKQAEADKYALWGVDQEYLFSADYMLSDLLDMTTSETAQNLVKALLERAQALRQQNIPNMFVLQDADLSPIKAAFEINSAALRIISELETSFRIYFYFFRANQGETQYFYHNNNERERLMKANFIRHYRETQQRTDKLPKAVLRFGETHASRGLSPTKVYSLTNFVAELAATNGLEIFNILMIAGPGTQCRGAGDLHLSELADAEWIQPLVELAGKDDWALFDFRPLRPTLGSHLIDGLSPRLENLFWRYDSLLILNNSTPASLFT